MKSSFYSFILASALLSSACADLGISTTGSGSGSGGWQWPWQESYRYIGTAEYDQKNLFDIQGEFDQIAISPSGRQVAFSGRDNLNDFALFIGDIGGKVRKLTKCSFNPIQLAWSSDESTLTYIAHEVQWIDEARKIPKLPPRQKLEQASLSGGPVRTLKSLPGNGALFVAPDGRRIAIYGYVDGSSKLDAPFKIWEVGTDTEGTLESDTRELYLTTAGQWNAAGTAIAIYGSRQEQGQYTQFIEVFEAPHWKKAKTYSLAGSSYYLAMDWRTGEQGPRAFTLEAGDLLFYTPGENSPVKRFPLGQAPTPSGYVHEGFWASPDGERVLLTRSASQPGPGVEESQVIVPSQNVLLNLKDQSVQIVAPNLRIIGWLDASRVLCYSGKDQKKRLQVVSL